MKPWMLTAATMFSPIIRPDRPPFSCSTLTSLTCHAPNVRPVHGHPGTVVSQHPRNLRINQARRAGRARLRPPAHQAQEPRSGALSKPRTPALGKSHPPSSEPRTRAGVPWPSRPPKAGCAAMRSPGCSPQPQCFPRSSDPIAPPLLLYAHLSNLPCPQRPPRSWPSGHGCLSTSA